jgi:alkanesulfonate monooxygenase SsuD/methylene tetrahydromethanopterin reductase-like flavin-dependent oxidoreductase (luciferase family)
MVEFIGMILTQDQSEAKGAEGPLIDPEFTARFARAHEAAGFDRVLVGYFSFFPDGFQVAAYALHETRTLGVLLAHRPGFVAPTALARAYGILAEVQQRRPSGGVPMGNAMERGVGSQRLLTAARRGDILDRCLFMPLAPATGAAGNSTALVGSPETVAAAMLDYHEIGVTTFLIRGYDPYEDLEGYREVISLVREGVTRRLATANSEHDRPSRR